MNCKVGRTCSAFGSVHASFRYGNLRRRDHFEDQGVEWRIILNGPSTGIMGGRGMYFSGTDKGQVSGCCEHGNEPSVFVKYRGTSSLVEEMLASQE
jgi:hypothetical protein